MTYEAREILSVKLTGKEVKQEAEEILSVKLTGKEVK